MAKQRPAIGDGPAEGTTRVVEGTTKAFKNMSRINKSEATKAETGTASGSGEGRGRLGLAPGVSVLPSSQRTRSASITIETVPTATVRKPSPAGGALFERVDDDVVDLTND